MLDATEQQVLKILAPAIARNRAFMLGIVPPVEIDAYYAASDIFVLPSMFQETLDWSFSRRFPLDFPSSHSGRVAFLNSSKIERMESLSPRATRRLSSKACGS